MNRIRSRRHERYKRVTGFMMRHDLPFLIRNFFTLPLGTGHHALDRFLELRHADRFLVETGGQKRGLIHQVREIRARKISRLLRDRLEIHRGVQLDLDRMDFQDRLATDKIRQRNHDLPVKPTGTKQGRIQNIRSVCCGNQNDPFIGFKPVHFHKELV